METLDALDDSIDKLRITTNGFRYPDRVPGGYDSDEDMPDAPDDS